MKGEEDLIRLILKVELIHDELEELKKQTRFHFENIRYMVKGFCWSLILMGIAILSHLLANSIGK